jgi:hypothetical protein
MKKLSLIFVLLFFVQNMFAQEDFWMQKSYKRWTKAEIEKLAGESPWATLVGDNSNAQVTNASYVTVRLRSSILIRQALVRLKQIESNYDKMDSTQKAEFDGKTKGTMECPACQENYAISISPPISNRQVRSGISSLINIKFEQLKGKIYLQNDKGERREMVFFSPPLANDGEATLFFPRLDSNGKPFLTKDNKNFSIIFDKKNSGALANISIPENTTFDVQKMLIDGNVEF